MLRRLASPLCWLLIAAPAAAQAAVLEPAAPLPGDLGPEEAGGLQHEPYVAAGGAGALAVWIDHRAEFTLPLAGQGGPDVYAMRLDAGGAPLDPVAIRLPFAVGDKSWAKAAWNGSAWLVTWENQQPLGTSSFFRRILGARVAADGTVLDATPLVLKDDLDSAGSSTAVASDGVEWVVVVQGTAASSGRVVGVRVAADGTVLNPGGTKIFDLSTAMIRPDLAYASGTYLLVWGSSTVRGQRFAPSLAPLGGQLSVGAGSSNNARVATDGTDFLVAWQNQDLGVSVRARRVTAAGAQSTVLQVSPLSNGEYNWYPDVAWSGAAWHVAFYDSDDDVYRDARITPGLTLVDAGGAALPFGDAPPEARIGVAGVGGGVVAAFERTDLSLPWPGELLAASIDDALAAGTPTSLSLSATRQGFPAVAAGPAQHLVAWQGEEHATTTIEVQRLDAFGAPLDPEPLEVAAGDRYGKPAVAWNGEVYLVVWEDLVVPSFQTDDVVLGVRVAPDGTVLDPVPFVVLEGSMPAVAAQGDTFLVVASDAPTTHELRYAYAQRVASDGALVGPATQVGGSFARWPAVAPYGDGWIVLWQRNFTHDNPNSVVDGALVDVAGTPGPTFGVDGAPGFGGASRPAVASRGDEALLVWQDDFTGLAARVLDAAGTLQPPFQVAALPALPAGPEATWNGDEYAVVWEDYRALVGLWDYRSDVYAARVSAAGALLDAPEGFAVAAGQETELQPAVAGALGASLLVWTEHLPEAPHATLRVVARRESPWATEHGGVGGPAGAPVLQAQGDLAAGGSVTFWLSGAAPSAPAGLVLGGEAASVPFHGGVLVPALHVVQLLVTTPEGGLAVPVAVPPSIAAGTTIHAQAWLLDAAAPFGLAGSNAVAATAP